MPQCNLKIISPFNTLAVNSELCKDLNHSLADQNVIISYSVLTFLAQAWGQLAAQG
jgi:hypothetical protein